MPVNPASAVSYNTSSVSNYNLTIHTSAPTENIMVDYAVLRSLAGA